MNNYDAQGNKGVRYQKEKKHSPYLPPKEITVQINEYPVNNSEETHASA